MQFELFSHQYWMDICILMMRDEPVNRRTGEPANRRTGEPENRRTSELANWRAGELAKEVPIGALIVKENKLITRAVNKIESFGDATAHAEILVIREASRILGDWRLNGCTLYTTLEPCSMCAGAIINSRISKLVFGAYDINYGACGSKINLFSDLKKEGQIEVTGGILEIEGSKLLKEFFVNKR